MSFESTPGISTRSVDQPKRSGSNPRTEHIFVFDLSEMTLATAFANPLWPNKPIPEWSIAQLFDVMMDPVESNEEEAKKLLPDFLAQFRLAIAASPLNDEAIRHAAQHTLGVPPPPKPSARSEARTRHRRTQTKPRAPSCTSRPTRHGSISPAFLGSATICSSPCLRLAD